MTESSIALKPRAKEWEFALKCSRRLQSDVFRIASDNYDFSLSNKDNYDTWWLERSDYMHQVLFRYSTVIEYLNKGLPDDCLGKQWKKLSVFQKQHYDNVIPILRVIGGGTKWADLVKNRNFIAHEPSEVFLWNDFALHLTSEMLKVVHLAISHDGGVTYKGI